MDRASLLTRRGIVAVGATLTVVSSASLLTILIPIRSGQVDLVRLGLAGGIDRPSLALDLIKALLSLSLTGTVTGFSLLLIARFIRPE